MSPSDHDTRERPTTPDEATRGNHLATHFASPERSSEEEVLRHHRLLKADPIIRGILEGYPEPVVILDVNRQIVMANNGMAAIMGATPESLLGRRPGEALACIHSDEMPAGCGTSQFCQHCGAAQSLVDCRERGEQRVEECRITQEVEACESSLDLRVWATPITIEGETYTIFALRDTTDEKRRQVLERIFFHDILNVAGGLRGLTELLQCSEAAEYEELHGFLGSASKQLVEEILAQKELAAAECGDLDCTLADVDAAWLLDLVRTTYAHHVIACDKTIDIGEVSGELALRTDAVLLSRVLGNLVKNALEASAAGQVVRVSYGNVGQPEFRVWNEGVMPEEVQLQMFQRSFSTKGGTGRGLGSYSVKLLAEQYLGGHVTFTSEEGQGTTFVVTLPAAE